MGRSIECNLAANLFWAAAVLIWGLLAAVQVLDIEGSITGEEDDIARAVEQIAEYALLGAGNIDTMFPESLDEAYAVHGTDEMEWRVVL